MLMADTEELAYALCEILDGGDLAVREWEWERVAAVYRREDPEAHPEGDGYDICAIWDMGKHVLVHTGNAGRQSSLPLLQHGTCPPPQGNCYHTVGSLAEFVNALKSASSKRMRRLFATELDHDYWKPYFWSLAILSGASVTARKNCKELHPNPKR